MALSWPGSNVYAKGDSPITCAAASQYSFAVWAYPVDTTSVRCLMCVRALGASGNGPILILRGGDAGTPVRFSDNAGGSSQAANTSEPYAANQWQLFGGWHGGASDRGVVLVKKVSGVWTLYTGTNTNTLNTNPSTPLSVVLAAVQPNATSFHNGYTGPAGIWSTKLSGQDFLSLGSGASFLSVQPSKLEWLAAHNGRSGLADGNTLIDLVKRNDITITDDVATGAPTFVEDPPLSRWFVTAA